MSDHSDSQLSVEDDEIVWMHGTATDTDFIVLRHPLDDAHSLPSTLSDHAGHRTSDSGLSPALENISLRDSFDTSSASAQSDDSPSEDRAHTDKRTRARKTKHSPQPSNVSSSEYHSGTSTPPSSYEDASAFISRFISSPIKGNDAQLGLLRALIIELGIRSSTSDLPSTLTSARKILKAEAHVNIKEYATVRHKGQSALREILKPSKSALRKDIKKGNGASLQWVKERGLQVLLVTCFS